ncbi:MAG: pyrroline-5-carboxylate reductase [Nitrosomonas sp.]|nr:pyrroline-5-carboxylate reductase [Nitrosomonas sp.]MDP1949541.1 pyrroline-5-carboxylate reductase [Nitrosomonas sp.]
MNITFIGGGNMAAALIGGMLQQGFLASQIKVVEISAENRERIKREFDIEAVPALDSCVIGNDVIILAVKPQQLTELAQQLAPLLKNQLVISIAAGIRATDISRWLGGYPRIVRAMPNTPALVRAGVTGLYALPAVNEQEMKDAETILAAVGTVLWVGEEEILHTITAISGSGPAYIFYFIEAMQQAGVELGLAADQARQLSLQTFFGAVKLAEQSGEDVAVLRSRVTSKGGTTERAIQTMEKNDIKRKIICAIHAASARSQELSDEFGKK